MPLLQFDTTLSLSDAEKTALADRVTELYAIEMETTRGHVAVTIRERDEAISTSGAPSRGRCSFSTSRVVAAARSVSLERVVARTIAETVVAVH